MLHLGTMTTCATSVVVIDDQAPPWPSELVHLADHDAFARFGCRGAKAGRFQSIVGIEEQQVGWFELPSDSLQPVPPCLLSLSDRSAAWDELTDERGAGKDVYRLQFPNMPPA